MDSAIKTSRYFLVLMAMVALSSCNIGIESEVEMLPVDMGAPEVMEEGGEMEDEHMEDEVMDSEMEMESEGEVLEESTQNYTRGMIEDYSREKLDAALANGETVLLSFDAIWCSTCRANEPIIEAFLPSTEVVALKVDYDTESELKSEYGVNLQSTYIVLSGEDERRYTGSLSEARLTELVEG